MRLRTLVQGLACCAILGLVVSTASARLRVDKVSFFLPGVNYYGYLDYWYGNWGTAKIYNYTRLDLLVATATGKVTNESGRVFADTNIGGFDIYDFDDGYWRSPTSDVYVVGARRGHNRAPAVGVAVHNPWLAQ